jgi:hypothetical protein
VSSWAPSTSAVSGCGELGVAAPAPTGGRRSLVAIAVAALAIVVALGSMLVSWRALDQASDARDIANARGTEPPAVPVDAPTQNPTTDPVSTDPTDVPTAPDDPTTTGAVPTLNAQTQYTVKYEDESLKISAGCTEAMYIDLDEPRLGVASEIAEISFDTPCGSGPSTISLSPGVVGSAVDTAETTPADCNDKIRTSRLSETPQPARRGRVFCVMTNVDNARTSGDTWKMVIVEIASTAQDGTVTLRVDAWNIPD